MAPGGNSEQWKWSGTFSNLKPLSAKGLEESIAMLKARSSRIKFEIKCSCKQWQFSNTLEDGDQYVGECGMCQWRTHIKNNGGRLIITPHKPESTMDKMYRALLGIGKEEVQGSAIDWDKVREHEWNLRREAIIERFNLPKLELSEPDDVEDAFRYRFLGDWGMQPFSFGMPRPSKETVVTSNKSQEKPRMSLSSIAKRLLDKDTKTLVKAGYLDTELDLTEKGQEALDALNLETHKTALVALAQEDLDEENGE